ncbi:Spy/CpxP family protein refolding chaperone [Rheinheimera marina]|uniref:Spy/CpxP family protein refolding chaperone n=1 Tax=Rheinheimera marina TaxID=1774958 RepID=A0ABV9JME3_9GAMM
MKAKTLTALLFSTLVAATSLTAIAGQDRGHHGPMPGAMMQLKGLDLTDTQKEQVKTLMEQARASMPAKADMQAQHEQLKTLIQAENFDEAAVRTVLQSQQSQRLEAEVSRSRLQHDIYQLLTAEQKAKLAEREQKREARMQE